MKRLELPRNKFLKLLINVGFIVGWYFPVAYIYAPIQRQIIWFFNKFANPYEDIYNLLNILVLLVPMILVTRYIWFEKSRNKIFYGLFGKLKKIEPRIYISKLKNLEPRIYTNTSNADELKKYADLKDQGIITEDEFQAKKKKLLDL